VQDQAKRIVILGGGTAGWMTASLMAKKWAARNFDITLIESTDIGVVGVGEGSTPPLREFFRHLQIPEQEWMPECNATYKNGISFVGWSTKPGFERYFHPFASGMDAFTLKPFEFNTRVRRRGVDVEAHPDPFFLTALLAERRLAPIPGEDFPFSVDYGYHFDSMLLGAYLRRKMVEAGVRHVDTRIVEVNQLPNGDISSLMTEAGDRIEGDFFVDCTGFKGLLIEKTLGVGFRGFAENLFNDRAIAMPSETESEIISETISTAMKYGWAWRIPLQNRYGNGYVYSSAYCSDDEAEKELRESLDLLDADVDARLIRMRVGRLEQNWANNCVAIGLSQGFIEPLEATGIQIILSSIQGFMDAWEDGEFTPKNRDLYNRGVADYFEHIRDYIVLHYKSNSRTDTTYWRDNFENPHISDSLKHMIKCWLECGDLAAEIDRQKIEQYYASISWHAIFAGMGIFPDDNQLKLGAVHDYQTDMVSLRKLIEYGARTFQPQRQFLGEQREASGSIP
jgi:flavin-dependent dehydrogenase